jgi:hypothetical protein
MVESETERGSREGQMPRATAARKRSTAWLNTSGSSRLAVWPVRGRTLDAASDPHPVDYPYGELGVDQRSRTLGG